MGTLSREVSIAVRIQENPQPDLQTGTASPHPRWLQKLWPESQDLGPPASPRGRVPPGWAVGRVPLVSGLTLLRLLHCPLRTPTTPWATPTLAQLPSQAGARVTSGHWTWGPVSLMAHPGWGAGGEPLWGPRGPTGQGWALEGRAPRRLARLPRARVLTLASGPSFLPPAFSLSRRKSILPRQAGESPGCSGRACGAPGTRATGPAALPGPDWPALGMWRYFLPRFRPVPPGAARSRRPPCCDRWGGREEPRPPVGTSRRSEVSRPSPADRGEH